MTISHPIIPDQILVDTEFWGRPYAGDTIQATVIALLRDSTGDQYCVFETADQAGLQVIHLGSNFFKGWTTKPQEPTEIPHPDVMPDEPRSWRKLWSRP